MRTFYFFALISSCTSFYHSALAQTDAKLEYSGMMYDWHEGAVYIDEKTVVNGQLRFNYFENVLHLTLADGNIRAFNAQNIQGFELSDASGRRHFISVSPDDESSQKDFFEILVECKKFALMRHQRAYSYQKTNNSNMFVPQNVPVVVKERSYYIFDDAGEISLYLIVANANSGDLFLNKANRKKVVETDLLEKYMKDAYADVKAYAKKNSLNFKKEDDLLQIFEFYKDIEN
jgi:hypothetical protein